MSDVSTEIRSSLAHSSDFVKAGCRVAYHRAGRTTLRKSHDIWEHACYPLVIGARMHRAGNQLTPGISHRRRVGPRTVAGYGGIFMRRVGRAVDRLGHGLQIGYTRFTSACRKRGSCDGDGSINDGEGGFERPLKKQRLAAEGEVEVQAWAGTSPVSTNESEVPSDSVPVSAAPPTGAPPVSPGLLHTTAPAIRRGDRQARCAKYLLAAKEGLARARSVIDDIRARLDLPENSANVPEVPVREPVTHGDSPTPDATPADGPTAVHNLPGSDGGSVSWSAGPSAIQSGSGVPQATNGDESQQGLEGVWGVMSGGVMSGGKAMPALERPDEMLLHDPKVFDLPEHAAADEQELTAWLVQVPQLPGSRPLSPPPVSPTRPVSDCNPHATPDPAALFQREAVPLGVQPRRKSLEGEAAGTARQQSSPVSQAEGGGSHASISSGGSGDQCARDDASKGCSSGGRGSGSSGSGSRSGRTDKHSSGGSQAGSGAAVQSALPLPASPADDGSSIAKPSFESGHDNDASKARGGGGGGGQQGGASGDSSAAAAPTLSAQEIASGVLAPDSDFSRYYAKWQVLQALKHRQMKPSGVKGGGVRKTVAKGIGVKRRVGKGGEAGRSAGTAAQHVPGSTNCNAKEEANAFLAGMGLHATMEEGPPAGSRGSQGVETLGGVATAPANTGVAWRMVNQECADPAPEADMEEEEWDYSFPGAEQEPGWSGTIAPHQLTPPDEAPVAAPSAAPTGKPCRLYLSNGCQRYAYAATPGNAPMDPMQSIQECFVNPNCRVRLSKSAVGI
ncbi:hypothetical protein ABBQ38_012845 [Trebouxia sp. C0009 RCD-2024]